MSETIKINGYLYHKVRNPKDLKEYLAKGTMINKYGQKIPVTESVLHWAGSSYSGYSEHYQINVCFDPKTKEHFLLVADESHFLNPNIHSHTWRRNPGKIGISFICMYDVKKYPVTEFMMHIAADTHVELAKFYSYPIYNLFDHQDYAKIDNYEGLRWDCELKLDNETVSSRTFRYAKEKYAEETNKDKNVEIILSKPVVVPTKHIDKTPTVFSDVFKEDWYSKSIEYLEQKDILEGYKSGKDRLFKPQSNITRLEVANACLSITKTLHINPTFEHKIFSDILVINHSIDFVTFQGIMSGYPDNTFRQAKCITRAELSVVLNNLYIYIYKSLNKPLKKYTLQEETFLDIDSKHWAYESIVNTYSMSLLIGYKEQTGHYFRPDNFLTRAEFAATLYKFFSKTLS